MKAPSNNREQALQLLRDLADLITRTLSTSTDIDQDTAQYLGQECANGFAAEFGKQLVYMPIGLALHMSSRNDDIYREFTGNNHAELAKKYKLTVVRIYAIVKERMKADLESRQPDMFR